MRNINVIDALLSQSVQGILTAALLDRSEPWYLSDLAKRLGKSPSTLQRPLSSLVRAGILQRSVNGNRVYYAANLDCPIILELKGMLLKTVGLVDAVRAAIDPILDRIEIAFIYGSLARGEATSGSDVDLMVVGAVSLAELTPMLTNLEAGLTRPVNVSLFPPHEFQEKLARGNHFLHSILQAEKLFVIGTEHDLERLSTSGTRRRPSNQQGGTRRSARRHRAQS